MTADEGATIAQQFLDAYLEENDWFTPADQVVRDYLKRDCSFTNVLMFFGSMPEGEDAIRLSFFHGREVDPEGANVDRLVQKCILALKKAHPELAKLRVEYDIARE